MSARFRETWRDAVRAVDRRPGDSWRDRWAHHGARALLVVLFAALLPFLFPRSPLPEAVSLSAGAIADQDVIAAFEFTVPKPPAQLARERAESERVVAPVYSLDAQAADSARGLAAVFFKALDSAVVASGRDGIEGVTAAYGFGLNPGQVAFLEDAGRRNSLQTSLDRAYAELLPDGVAPILDLSGPAPSVVLLRTPEGDRRVPRDSLRTVGGFLDEALAFAPTDLSLAGFQLYQNLLFRFTVPSLRFDAAESEAARMQARTAVDTVLGTVLEGERIVSAHERVSERELVRLRAYNEALSERGLASEESRRRTAVGSFLFGVLMLGLFALVLMLYRSAIYRDARSYLLVMGLVALGLVGASVVYRVDFPPELVPVVLIAIPLAALWDGLMALVAVVVIAVLLAGLTELNVAYYPLVLLVAGAAAALGVLRMRKRTHGWALIAAIAGAYIVSGFAIGLLESLPLRIPAETSAWGLVAATLYTFLALGALIPLLEKLTGISTDQTLLELSDLNAPLLRELSRKAPGTYAHSIGVANLAEAACLAVGANALLARAGVYYHDVGKMENPQYFVENQPKGRNPHDRLSPSRSAAIIREHVRDGLKIASEHRLPPFIHDFVCEHHGTSVISYFLDKARNESPDTDVDPADFAYPGPKPQSRETAIVMLADGIESATRVLQDPTPERIKATIDAIVQARIDEGQLDQCPLTLRDLERTKAAFARILIGMYHRRIEYPSGVRAREEIPQFVASNELNASETGAPEPPAVQADARPAAEVSRPAETRGASS
ncbi:MAG: HDIG domain-containing protein [marine benthic group bacterium]|nr:HDIG domain-containing protein [Gemmatimonadota bacterium]MCL7964474.1 HDIG domain-containing protein [Gemmatimonadota bacterium]